MVKSLSSETNSPRICVAGAGAIGLTLTARLILGGFRVGLVARGESIPFIEENGIRLIDNEGDHRMQVEVGEAANFPPVDILFLCPKSQDMPMIAAATKSLIASNTIIVPVINGIPWWYFDGKDDVWDGPQIKAVDPEGTLKRLIPSRQVIGVTTTMTVERTQLGTAKTFNPLQMTIGELDDRSSERLDNLADLLVTSGIAVRKAVRIRDAIWTKVVRNLISNPVTAVSGATLRQNFGNSYLVNISRQMLYEALPVIAAYDAKLEDEPGAILASGQKFGDVKTSMLQDLERGNQLELAAICDAVIEFAKLRGIAMPVTQAISNLAHFKSAPGEAFAA